MDLLLLSRHWEWAGGRIRGVLGTAVIVGVVIVFLGRERESSGWGVHDTGCHGMNDDGRRKSGEREGGMPL
jgi:hypothetical protein